MTKKRILITGAAGRIGSSLSHALANDYDLVLLDIRKSQGVIQVDLLDLEKQLPYYKGVDVVIHLAANAAVEQGWEDVLEKTIVLTQRVFEAARLSKVSKIIFASTNHVMGNYYEDPEFRGGKITEDMEVRPDSFYGAGKVFGENLCRLYSDAYGIDCVSLRIGAFSVLVPGDDVGRKIWISERDMVQMILKTIEGKFHFEIFNAVSDNDDNYFSLAKSREMLGYEPQDGVEINKMFFLEKLGRKVHWLLKNKGYGLRVSIGQRKSQAELVVDCGCVVGEQPVWNAIDSKLYWVDMGKGKVYCYNSDTGNSSVIYENESAGIGGITIQESGELIVFLNDGSVIGTEQGKIRQIVKISFKGKFRFNDAIVDPVGRVICGTVGNNGESGSLFLIEKDGKVRKIADDAGFSNGMGFSPDGLIFYHTDSNQGIIFKYSYDQEKGMLGDKAVFVKMAKYMGVPDGLAVDVDGFVWSALWGGRSVVRFDLCGKKDRVVYLPIRKVSSCAFGGNNNDELYVTSAGGDDKKGEGVYAGGLFRLKLGIVGKAGYQSKIK